MSETTLAVAGPNSGSTIAEVRVLRAILRVFGISAVVFFVLLWDSILVEFSYLHSWWSPIALAIDFGLPVALALACGFLSLRAMRAILAAYAVGFVLVVTSFVPAMTVIPLPAELSPWPLGITAIGSVAAALVWRQWITWLYLVLNIVAMVVVRFAAGGGVDLVTGLQDGFFSLSFSAIFTALAIVTMRNARAIDRAAARAQLAAARAAGASARAQEQARLDAIVHDEIMTALLYASSDSPALAQSVQRQAQRALQQLAQIARDDNLEGISPLEFIGRLGSVHAFDGRAVSFSVDGERTKPIPPEVASAFVEATSEAVRNSLRHGQRASAELHIDIRVAQTNDRLGVVVEDDGIGFDPGQVPPHRLGISGSIEGRLGLLPGGSARVHSRRGGGTSVTLEWRQP